jgi:hypothetical protein
LPLCPLGCKENEPKGQPFTWSRVASLPEVYTPLRGAARKERATSESRKVYSPLRGTPPSRFSVLCGVYAPFFGALLGGVKWQFLKKSTLFCGNADRITSTEIT